MIREGAALVEKVEDILEALRGWQAVASAAGTEVLATAAHPLLDLLRAAPYSSEGLAAISGWELPRLLAELTDLELQGHVAREAGCWVHRQG